VIQRQPSIPDLLFEAACVARRAPSIANSQPWQWRIVADMLELRADRTRQLAVADPDGQLMVVSCGAVLHHACVVLATLGLDASVTRVDDDYDPDLLARITVTGEHTVTLEDLRLHHALRTRTTDRRPFRGLRPLPRAVPEQLRRSADPFGIAVYTFTDEQVSLLANAARSAHAIEESSPEHREEMALWTSRRDVAAGLGVPATAAVPDVDRAVPVRSFAPDDEALADPGPGDDRFTLYIALISGADSRSDWLRAGQALSAILLTATSLGIASSVLSEVVEVPAARALVASMVAPGGTPQLTVRLGLNESAPPLPMTPRRACGDTITVVEAAG
jgi:hypothetical protein